MTPKPVAGIVKRRRSSEDCSILVAAELAVQYQNHRAGSKAAYGDPISQFPLRAVTPALLLLTSRQRELAARKNF